MCVCFQLSKIKSDELTHRKKVLDEKVAAVEEMQSSLEELAENQEKLKEELDQIRALQPKV